jgi:hypothetical protein
VFSIASCHSRTQLALGRRFFTMLVVAGKCRMLGAEVDAVKVPWLYWDPCPAIREFEPDPSRTAADG